MEWKWTEKSDINMNKIIMYIIFSPCTSLKVTKTTIKGLFRLYHKPSLETICLRCPGRVYLSHQSHYHVLEFISQSDPLFSIAKFHHVSVLLLSERWNIHSISKLSNLEYKIIVVILVEEIVTINQFRIKIAPALLIPILKSWKLDVFYLFQTLYLFKFSE